MLSSTLYARLPSKPAIHLFKNSAPEIVGVGGASAEVRGYVDVPLQIAGVEVAHPLLVVQNLGFPLLVGADILRPHAAALLFGSATPVKLNARVCDVCLEQREDSEDKFQCATAIAFTAEAATVAPNSALLVCVRVPSAVQDASTIAVEPLYSSTVNFSCVALPAVCTPIDGKCKIAIVNPSSKPIEIGVDSPIAAV